jgi:antitoxin (DNA-binding transcriptional repressor) of toxin-antitoxin stability system
MSHKTRVHDSGEVYNGIRPAKQPNRSGTPPTEAVEERPWRTRNSLTRAGHRARKAGTAGWIACARQQGRTERRGSQRYFTTRQSICFGRVTTAQEEGGARSGWGDVGRIWKKPGGEPQRPARSNPSGAYQALPSTESLDPERRGTATPIGNRSAGGQERPACGRDGPGRAVKCGHIVISLWSLQPCGRVSGSRRIRELKAHLSRHLKRVRSGVRLVVTERGRSIATINPVDVPADVGWAHRLVAERRAHWDGGKPAGCSQPVSIAAGKTVSGAVLEDRP